MTVLASRMTPAGVDRTAFFHWPPFPAVSVHVGEKRADDKGYSKSPPFSSPSRSGVLLKLFSGKHQSDNRLGVFDLAVVNFGLELIE